MARVFYDEMHDAAGACRPHYTEFARWLADMPGEHLQQRRREADLLFYRAGIPFTLYGDDQGTERLIPFDTIPSRGAFPPANGRSSRPAASSVYRRSTCSSPTSTTTSASSRKA